jgi:hypothetical protein
LNIWLEIENRIGGVMVSVIGSGAVHRGFQLWSVVLVVRHFYLRTLVSVS